MPRLLRAVTAHLPLLHRVLLPQAVDMVLLPPVADMAADIQLRLLLLSM
jgi:hypothetical protein